AGVYRIGTDGSGLQLLFSYADLASAVFGTDGSEYNINTAFDGLDVSGDDSRILVATRQEGGAIATWDGPTFHKMHAKSVSSSRNETLSISGDGNTVAYVPANSPIVYSNAFAGGQERELWNLGGLNTASMQFNQDGSRLVADGWGTGGSPSVRLLHGDGSWCLDLMPRLQGYFSEHVSISNSGSRAIWLSAFDDPNSLRQIWVCDIDVPSPGSFPTISNVSMDPDYLLLDGSNTTEIAADMDGGGSVITRTNVDPVLDGRLQFRALGFFTNPLLDDGLGNDAVANDGRFTSANLRRDGVNAVEATYTLRLAGFTEDRITAVDVPGLRMSDGLPEELADTDGDGLSDLLEDAFGTDPSTPDAADWALAIMADPGLSITFSRHPGGTVGADGKYSAQGVVYSIEGSSDLRVWGPVDDQIESVRTVPAGAVERVTAQLSVALREGGVRYLRVRVARPTL
ncbi:MAG: hypothetical protein ACR2RV_12365, partial [Verrucomicrobiales bacterium]